MLWDTNKGSTCWKKINQLRRYNHYKYTYQQISKIYEVKTHRTKERAGDLISYFQ